MIHVIPITISVEITNRYHIASQNAGNNISSVVEGSQRPQVHVDESSTTTEFTSRWFSPAGTRF